MRQLGHPSNSSRHFAQELCCGHGNAAHDMASLDETYSLIHWSNGNEGSNWGSPLAEVHRLGWDRSWSPCCLACSDQQLLVFWAASVGWPACWWPPAPQDPRGTGEPSPGWHSLAHSHLCQMIHWTGTACCWPWASCWWWRRRYSGSPSGTGRCCLFWRKKMFQNCWHFISYSSSLTQAQKENKCVVFWKNI